MQILNGGNQVFQNERVKITFPTHGPITDIKMLPNAYVKLVNSDTLEAALVPMVVESVGADLTKANHEDLTVSMGQFLHVALIETFLGTMNFTMAMDVLRDAAYLGGDRSLINVIQFGLGTTVMHALSAREVTNRLFSDNNESHQMGIHLGHGLEFRTINQLDEHKHKHLHFGRCKLFYREYEFSIRRIGTAVLCATPMVSLNNYVFDPAMLQDLVMNAVEKQFPFLTLQDYFEVEEFYTLKPDTMYQPS